MRRLSVKIGMAIILGILITSVVIGTGEGGKVHASAHRTLSSPCWASGCNHLDPYTMGCQYGAYAVQAAHKDVVYNSAYHFVIDNWYSPNCNANWSVATIVTGTIQFVSINSTVFDCYPNISSSNFYCDQSAPYITASPAWTNMVDGSVKAQACVTPYHPVNAVC